MKKALNRAAISGIVLVCLLFLSPLLGAVLSVLYNYSKNLAIVLTTVLSLVIFLSYILFYSGFFVLSRKLNNKLLSFSSAFCIAWPIIYAIIALILFLNFNQGIKIFNFPEVPHGAVVNLTALAIFYLIILFFSIALFKLGKMIDKITGVLGMISAISGIAISTGTIAVVFSNNLILILAVWVFGAINLLVSLAFLIMQIVLLFRASYGFEK